MLCIPPDTPLWCANAVSKGTSEGSGQHLAVPGPTATDAQAPFHRKRGLLHGTQDCHALLQKNALKLAID